MWQMSRLYLRQKVSELYFLCAGGELHCDILRWPRPLLPYPPLPPQSPARGGCQSQDNSDCGVLTEGPPGAQPLSQRLR